MTESSKVLITSVAITAIVVFLTTAGSVQFLYKTAVDEQKERLLEFVKTQAIFIKVVHRETATTDPQLYDGVRAGDHAGEESTGCDDELINIFLRFSDIRKEEGIAESEKNPALNFMIGEKRGDEVVFHVGTKNMVGKRTPLAKLADFPMGLALSGGTAVLETTDHTGKPVLSAYTGLETLGLGIVAKIFLDDLRRPFVRTGVLAALSALFLLSVGALVMRKMVAPFVTDLADQRMRLAKKNIALEEKVITDHLTGIYNRQFFNDQLEMAKVGAELEQRELAVIMFDIDRFKSINDTLGHLAGDQVLKELSALVKRSIRRDDILARWGGEEFVILMENTDLETAGKLAEKLCRRIRDHKFAIERVVTCSFGVAVYRSRDTSIDLLNRADKLLYRAKASGRDMVVCG